MEYNFGEVEKKWQKQWAAEKVFKTEIVEGKPKYYVLDMFPYPSGAGLHVGHPLGYIASDIFSRYKRLKGFNVLHPMGYDAYGLPAEQYAIQTGTHPAITTEKNLARYREQLDKIGFSFDWDREVRTSDPGYYKWTQWTFIQLFNSFYNKKTNKAESVSELISVFETIGNASVDAACNETEVFSSATWNAMSEKKQQEILMNYRLAYLAETAVNWCPALGTVLANDEVSEGHSVRGGHLVERKKMKQWLLRITAYADRLLAGLNTIDWTESIKEIQRNWIGRSEGGSMKFRVINHPLTSSGEDLGGVLPAGKSKNLPLTPSVGGGTQDEIDLPGSEENITFTKGYITTDPYTFSRLKERAKEMRKNLTEAEKIIWEKLRKNQIKYKIRRQQIIDNYIVDFVCLPKKTIIEIDGPIHDFQKEADEKRTQYLNSVGYEILRYENEEVIVDPDKVAQEIAAFLDSKVVPTEENFGEVLPSGEDLGGVLITGESNNLPSTSSGEDLGGVLAFGESKNLPLAHSVGGGTVYTMDPSVGGGNTEIEAPEIEVFTTRPDTIFGATFMVLAPEHDLVAKITTPEYHEKIEAYVSWAKNRTERERMTEVKKVSGEFTGAYAVNPFTSQPIPIWIADYVLMGYGTGAIMAVPAHDSRDFAFARHFSLPIVQVVNKPGHEATDPAKWEESYDSKEGIMINSGFIDGMHVKQAISAIIRETEKLGIGTGKINFRLRDAIFSRQRYWGEPFPVYYKDGMPYTLPEDQLPLLLPDVDAYLPTESGEPPLARAKNWVTSDGYPLETNTMPGFAGSSGYYLRYMDPRNDKEYFSKKAVNYWQSVDLYIGGAEHATGHLLYSRFWNKFLFDLGYSIVEEPFKKLINQGMIQGRSSFVYRIKGTNTFVSFNLRKDYDIQQLHVDVNIVENDILDTDKFREWRPDFAEAEFILEDGKYHCGWEVEKMSKSMHNVVNPDILIERYGADTLRLYEMFLGPLEQAKPWDTSGIEGVFRFIRKFWRLFNDSDNNFMVSDEAPTAAELKILHKTIKKIQDDTERISFNTAVSSFMICVNELTELKSNKRAILNELVILVSPYAPHIAEELWQLLGNTGNVCNATFPEYNASFTADNSFAYPVSFNGKTRFTLELPIDMTVPEIEKAVLNAPEAQKWLGGVAPKKVIIVPKKIVNIVI
ncbi:MAG: leucine--tRNA ligase [Lentimicrobiaceae bacterium]